MNPHATPPRPWWTAALLLFIVLSAACYNSPLEDVQCSPAGAVDGDRQCMDGFWVYLPDIGAEEDIVDHDVCTPPDDGIFCQPLDCGEIVIDDPCVGERTIDCGGCDDGDCVDNRCLLEECDDGEVSGTQTDADCGGPDCPPCDVGLACEEDRDCASQHCTDQICQAPTCDDEIFNGEETDIDCGGPDCPPCELEQDCLTSDDCQSQICLEQTCVECTSNDNCPAGSQWSCEDFQCHCDDQRSQQVLCLADDLECGDTTVVDACGLQRSVSCGDCTDPFEGCSPENLCVCVDDRDDAEICEDEQLQCGTTTVDDHCGAPREITCGDCAADVEHCNLETNQCDCEDLREDTALCEDSEAVECGLTTVDDACGEPRDVDCGGCTTKSEECSPENLCICVDDRHDIEICEELDFQCGTTTIVDNCQQERSITCSGCTGAFEFCDNANQCDCEDPRDDEHFCDALELQCGDTLITDGCGESRSVECGGCLGGADCSDNICQPLPCAPETEPFGGGSGTSDDPWRICSPDHLFNIDADPNHLADAFILVEDLSLAGYSGQIASETDPFQGTLYGNHRSLTHVQIDSTSHPSGLFVALGDQATLRDFDLAGVSITGAGHVGALAGINHGEVSNIQVEGSVNGANQYIGGVVGENFGDLRRVGFEGIVIGASGSSSTFTSRHVGGIAGANSGTIAGAAVSGAITNEHGRTGGITGLNVSGGQILQSAAHVTISSTHNEVGGLVGRQDSTSVLIASYAVAIVTGVDNVGGLIGHLTEQSRIEDSYAWARVDGGNAVGGLVGRGRNSPSIINSYAAGHPSTAPSGVTATAAGGGLVGYASQTSNLDVTHSYWDTETTEQQDSFGGTARNSSQLRNTTFFHSSWVFQSQDPDDYRWVIPQEGPPILWWQ